MAEIKNAFIKSKMNKDLDARLVPSGEYRNAMNISISQSEGGDVGAVENIKGNELKVDLGLNETAPDLGVIGYLMDDQNNCVKILKLIARMSKLFAALSCLRFPCKYFDGLTNYFQVYIQLNF